MPSIFNQSFQDQVAAAQGRPPNWGVPTGGSIPSPMGSRPGGPMGSIPTGIMSGSPTMNQMYADRQNSISPPGSIPGGPMDQAPPGTAPTQGGFAGKMGGPPQIGRQISGQHPMWQSPGMSNYRSMYNQKPGGPPQGTDPMQGPYGQGNKIGQSMPGGSTNSAFSIGSRMGY